MSIKPETLAWLRQTAKFEGGVTAQVLLHLLEQVEALEAKDQLDAEAWASMRRASCDYQRRLVNLEAAQQPRQDKLDRLIEQDREAEAIATARAALAAEPVGEVATDEEVQKVLRYYDLGRQHGAAQTPAANGSETAQVASDAADKVVINCPETCWIEIRRIADGKVLYDNYRRGTLVIPADEPPAAPPTPAGGLVERVAGSIWKTCDLGIEARAAIREVAEWLNQYGCHGCSLWLREEVTR